MIVGGKMLEASVKRMKEGTGEGMNVNINIESLEAKEKKVTVRYSYTVNYLPDIAEMTVRGEVYFEGTETEVKEIKKEWSEKKALPSTFAEELLTSVTYSGSTVGTLLAYTIGVPAPLNVPRARIRPPGEARQAPGSTGPDPQATPKAEEKKPKAG